jgi:hypothetical protein
MRPCTYGHEWRNGQSPQNQSPTEIEAETMVPNSKKNRTTWDTVKSFSVGFEVSTAVVMKSIIFWDAACHLLTCWFLLNYFFDPEDGGDIFLRNVGCNSTDYTASLIVCYAMLINYLSKCSGILIEKRIVAQFFKKFTAFYGTFATMLTRARHWSLSCTRSIQPTPSNPGFLKSITILFFRLQLGFSSDLVSAGFSSQIFMHFSSLPCVLHAPLNTCSVIVLS